MLPELMAANAAFAVIKQTVANSGDLLKAGKAISDFVNAKDLSRERETRKSTDCFATQTNLLTLRSLWL